MAFSDHKITEFQNRITALADQPNMQPDELKAYFDSSPEELRQAHNSLCDALTAPTAAADIGFAQTAGVPAGTVQAAIDNVQSQVTAAIIGSIPSGSIDGDKLAQDVRDRLTAIETAAANEANSRAGADTNLQNQINTHTTQIAAKCEVCIGSYIGDDAEQRAIPLGFYPHAVLLLTSTGDTTQNLGSGGYRCYGGLALRDLPCGPRAGYPGIVLTANGFTVYNKVEFENSYIYRYCNSANLAYYYIAFR